MEKTITITDFPYFLTRYTVILNLIILFILLIIANHDLFAQRGFGVLGFWGFGE